MTSHVGNTATVDALRVWMLLKLKVAGLSGCGYGYEEKGSSDLSSQAMTCEALFKD